MDGVPPEHIRAGRDVWAGARLPMIPRPEAGILGFSDGFDLLDPGLARISEWRPDRLRVPHGRGFAGVGRKP